MLARAPLGTGYEDLWERNTGSNSCSSAEAKAQLGMHFLAFG